MSDGPRGRNWCFTAYDPATDRFGTPSEWAQGYLRQLHSRSGGYVVGQLEKCPDTDRLHIQGFVQLPERKRFSQVKGLCPTECHLELAKAPKQALAYCKKADSRVDGPWSHGEEPKFQGRRSDLGRLYSQVLDNGQSPTDLLLNPDFGPTCMRNYKAVRILHRAVDKRRRLERIATAVAAGLSPLFPPRTQWIVGPTDIRKTSSIVAKHLVVYTPSLTKDGDSYWFDQYDGEKVLLLDEFNPNQLPVTTFLRLTGGDLMQLFAVKGESCYGSFEFVYIVQNTYTPYDVDAEVAAAIARRLTIHYCASTPQVVQAIA